MNIALLTTDSLPMIGGVSDYLHNLCLGIIKQNSLVVYSSVSSSSEFDARLPYPIRRISDTRRLGERRGDGLTPLRKMNTLCWYLQRPSEARRLLKGIQQEYAPNLVYIGRWEERSHFWCRACRAERLPYCLFAYGMELTERKPLKWQGRRQKDYLHAKRVFSISHGTSEMLMGFGVPEDKILLLPPGIKPVDLQPLAPTALKDCLLQFGLVENQYILCLARLILRKGVQLAIRAFGEIAEDYPELLLAVAGDGPEAPALQALVVELAISHRVKFLGTVSHETKRALLQGCKFFVMPNRPVPGDMEGFGIVFLEAAMYGKAVIGGNSGGVPDAVVDGQTGLLTDTTHTHEPLIRAMRLLLDNPEYRTQLGTQGKERAQNNFSWEILSQRFLKTIEQASPLGSLSDDMGAS
jgi:phosphatidyl-myo-inositol dimannoside synthase